MIGPLDALKLAGSFAIGALVASGLVAPAAYLKGEHAATAAAKTAALEKTVEILQERELTNAEISHADAADLCAHLGLQDGERDECVRRVADASHEAGNGGLRNHE